MGKDGVQAFIELRDVVKKYRTGAGHVTALKGINLQVQAGEYVGVVGPSGSGKSTLMNMITGIDKPTSGELFIGGQAIHRMGENELARWRGRNVGVVFQFFQLLPMLTIVENLMLPMDFCNVHKSSARRKRALQLLDQVGIVNQANKLPSALSGGEQQRAAIARALANDPPLIVADEPTGNLDSGSAAGVYALFDELVAQGKTLLVVTHNPELSHRTDRVVRIVDGAINVGSGDGNGGHPSDQLPRGPLGVAYG